MGLVLQAPTDALLPLADATATTAATPAQTAAETDGLFASLLASLSGSLDPQTSEAPVGEATAGAVPTEAAPPTPDDDKDTDPFAAYAALVAQLPQAPLDRLFALSAAGHHHKPGVEAVSETPAGATETGAVDALAHAAEQHARTHAPGLQPAETLAPEDGAAIAAAESAAAGNTTGATAPPEGSSEPPAGAAKPAEGLPPSEASTNQAATVASVVRSVGNAETGNDAEGSAQGNAFGRKEHDVRPAPRASENGMLHAAPNSAVGEARAVQDVAPADAPAPADTPAPSAEVPPQVEHVARTVIERVERGGGEARIHLDPAGLGEVTIHVHTQGDHVRVDVHAERHEAMQLLRDHTQDLSTLLGDRGLNLSDVNVGLGRGDAGQAWGQEQAPRNRPGSGEFASILGAGDTSALETHNRLRAAYNPDGAMVYRV